MNHIEKEVVEAFRTQREAPRTPPRTPKTPSGSSRSYRTPKTPSNTNDRFIPNRSEMDLELCHFKLLKENQPPFPCSPSRNSVYNDVLADSLLEGYRTNDRILSFKQKAPQPTGAHVNPSRVLYSTSAERPSNVPVKLNRFVPQKPDRILDAPNMLDDYYINTMDWGSDNCVAIALGSSVYLWDANKGVASELMTANDQLHVTSVAWAKQGSYMAVGLSSGVCELWDVATSRLLRTMNGHRARVGALSWNAHVLSTGSRDTTIQNHDVRVREHVISSYVAHDQEVCGLQWNSDGTALASGGNDNLLCVWDVANSNPKLRLCDHVAAVKAVAWCPWQKDLLASGGGTADRTIKFWNVNTGALLNSVDAHSQVSALLWSKYSQTKEIVSSHGFSQHQVTIWKYPSLSRVADLKGHSQRILSMVMSPDGSCVATASADETIRIWKIFDSPSQSNLESGGRSDNAKKTGGIFTQHRGLR
eukprot:TRINITY_DN3014_c0_g1_i1.p1 TRINITY_DN3014_c0_g1~~TRINITY_DN3014_c0_g1_i1.p1  ORF type:complete len:475 (+),score=93.23 TRINITY_DN3014_c0_g1_i1:130-1554(+)